MRVNYTASLDGVELEHLQGFFVGWPTPPSALQLSQLLAASHYRWLAKDESGLVIGYVTALSDGVLFGYVSSLEVLPEYQGQGIGKELMRLIRKDLEDVYAVDLVCDPNVQPFYERCGMLECHSMVTRNPSRIGNVKQEQ